MSIFANKCPRLADLMEVKSVFLSAILTGNALTKVLTEKCVSVVDSFMQ